MSRWCNTCYNNEYPSCNKDCVMFGKNFEELAKIVIEQQREIEALRWTNRHFVKTEKEKRRNLWKKAISEFEKRLTDRADLINVNSFDSKWVISQDDIDIIVREMTIN